MLDKPVLLSGPTGPYEHGYLMCRVQYADGFIKTIGWHKYIYERDNGRVGDEYVIHHKDEDKSNNCLNNLEKKLRSLHTKDHVKYEELIEFNCPVCNKDFNIPVREYKRNQIVKKKKGPYCSKSCAGKGSYVNPWK
jgi:hypothetical protein